MCQWKFTTSGRNLLEEGRRDSVQSFLFLVFMDFILFIAIPWILVFRQVHACGNFLKVSSQWENIMIQQLKKYFRNPGWYNTMGMWWGSILYWGTFKSVIPCLGPTLRPVKLGSLGCVAWALVSLKNLHEILMLFRVENYWSFLFLFFSFHLGNILWIPSMHLTLLGFCYSV